MKRIKFEDLLKLSEEEQDKICALSHSLNEDERVEIENPIKYMNDEETIEYFHKLGALTWEEVNDRISKMFDNATQKHNERACIGYINEQEYEVFVNTDDEGYIPHFHIRSNDKHVKWFETSIRYDSPQYFFHEGKEEYLDSQEREMLNDFFKQKVKSKKFREFTNWQLAIFEWNKNNSKMQLDEDLPIPDYKLLPSKPDNAFK